MTIVKLNKRKYTHAIYGRGIYGKYTRIPMNRGYGIVDTLGKNASKMVLSSIGKHSGSYAGKQLGRLIQEKTGSELLGKVAKTALGSLGGLAGNRIGKVTGKLLGETVFKEEEEKKKKKEQPKVSLSELLSQAREKIIPMQQQAQQGQGIRFAGSRRGY